MQKYWAAILILVALISCKEDKVEQQEDVAQTAIEKPVVKKFGFDFDELFAPVARYAKMQFIISVKVRKG